MMQFDIHFLIYIKNELEQIDDIKNEFISSRSTRLRKSMQRAQK